MRKKSKISYKLRKAIVLSMVIMQNFLLVPTYCYATNAVDEVLGPLNLLVTLILGIVSLIGVIMTVRSVSDLSTALQDRDTNSIKSAGLGVAGGFVMAAIGPVLKFLGVY